MWILLPLSLSKTTYGTVCSSSLNSPQGVHYSSWHFSGCTKHSLPLAGLCHVPGPWPWAGPAPPWASFLCCDTGTSASTCLAELAKGSKQTQRRQDQETVNCKQDWRLQYFPSMKCLDYIVFLSDIILKEEWNSHAANSLHNSRAVRQAGQSEAQ